MAQDSAGVQSKINGKVGNKRILWINLIRHIILYVCLLVYVLQKYLKIGILSVLHWYHSLPQDLEYLYKMSRVRMLSKIDVQKFKT